MNHCPPDSRPLWPTFAGLSPTCSRPSVFHSSCLTETLRPNRLTLVDVSISEQSRSFEPREPFSRSEAFRAGVSTDVLRSARYQKLWWDTYVERGVRVTPLLRAKAALRLAPATARISHYTAAQLWGAAVPSDQNTHLALPSAHGRLVRRGLRSHYGSAGASTLRHGLQVSTPEQTFVEMASEGLALVDLVVLGDSLVSEGHTTPERLVVAAAEHQGRGCRRARRAASLVRPGVDSPMETRLRLLLVLAGIPEPNVNVVLRAEDGSWQRRFDLAYPELKLIVEYDGRHHAEDARQWNADIYRREELERLGWRVLTVTAEGIYQEPGRTLDRVLNALRSCGARGLPRTFKAEWMVHFPSVVAV